MKGSVAIVTGASQGIGRATAVRLARDFSAIVLAARNAEALKEAAAEVKAAGAEPLGRQPAAKWLTGTSVRMDGGQIKGI